MSDKKDLFKPIIELFNGDDGGAAFAKLFHYHWDDFVSFAADPTHPSHEQAKLAINSFTHVSKICKGILR